MGVGAAAANCAEAWKYFNTNVGMFALTETWVKKKGIARLTNEKENFNPKLSSNQIQDKLWQIADLMKSPNYENETAQ